MLYPFHTLLHTEYIHINLSGTNKQWKILDKTNGLEKILLWGLKIQNFNEI